MVFRRPSLIAVALLAGAGALFPRTAAAQAPAPSGEPPAQAAQPRQPSQPPGGRGGAQRRRERQPHSAGRDRGRRREPAAVRRSIPAGDQAKLLKQGSERPTNDGTIGARPSEVYSEDWWAHTRPIIELHGYFRTRGELLPQLLARSPRDPQRQPEPLAAAARQQLHAPERRSRARSSLCGDSRHERVQGQDAVDGEPAPPPEPRDPHLGQSAHHVADRSAR